MLFPEKNRTDTNPPKHIDNDYDFIDRSALPELFAIRRLLNSWFENYPFSERKELKSRFNKTFSSAFFELFIHELFKRQGFTMIPHPKVPNSNKRPDFLAIKGSVEFYIEAKEATNQSAKAKGENNKTNTVYDSINRITSPNYLFSLTELIIKSDRQPQGKAIINHYNQELRKHDPDELLRMIEVSGRDAIPLLPYEDADIKIVIKPIPLPSEARGKKDIRPLGMYPMSSFWGNNESILTALEKKAGRYGELDKPFILCINATGDGFVTEHTVKDTLFGPLKATYSTNPNNRDHKLERYFEGFFRDNPNSKSNRVSGVFITRVNPGNVATADHWLVKHPFAKMNLDFSCFDLSYFILKSNLLESVAGKRISSILSV